MSVHRAEELRRRNKSFAFHVVRLLRTLPQNDEGRIIGRQLLRSAMSVAANYRAVSRSRSRAEFIAKVGVVVEEADESLFWSEALSEMAIVRGSEINRLLRECSELTSIFVASQRTTKRRPGYSSQPV